MIEIIMFHKERIFNMNKEFVTKMTTIGEVAYVVTQLLFIGLFIVSFILGMIGYVNGVRGVTTYGFLMFVSIMGMMSYIWLHDIFVSLVKRL